MIPSPDVASEQETEKKTERYSIMNSVFIEKYSELILFLLFLIIFFTVCLVQTKKQREALKKVSNYLPGSISKFSLPPSFRGVYQGLNFSIWLMPQGKRSSFQTLPQGKQPPPYFNMGITKVSFFKLRLYKESVISNIGEKIGIVHKVKINDEMFDEEFLILSDKPTLAINYLSNSTIKNTIRELFNGGFNQFSIDGKRFIIKKPNYDLNIDLEPQRITEALQKLSILAKGA